MIVTSHSAICPSISRPPIKIYGTAPLLSELLCSGRLFTVLNIAITGSNFVLSILLVEFPGHVLVDNNISRLVDTLSFYVGKTSNHLGTISLFTRSFRGMSVIVPKYEPLFICTLSI